MKKSLLSFLVMTTFMAPAFATTYYWTNASADNNFGTLANWNTVQAGTGTPAGDLAGDTLRINISDANRAVLSGTLADVPSSIQIGSVAGATGELLISGGTHTVSDTFRVAISQATATGILTMTGGTLNVANSYTTFGDTGTSIFTMSGGVINADRITFGQTATSFSTLTMTGGSINLSRTDLTSPPDTSGALRMGLGTTSLNISGTASLTMEKLYINEGGLLTLSGNASINILGATDSYPTFNFTDMNAMNGKIAFNGGSFSVHGQYESLLDDAIAAGKIYTANSGMSVDAVWQNGVTSLVLVPEPMSLVILGLGSLFLRNRKY